MNTRSKNNTGASPWRREEVPGKKGVRPICSQTFYNISSKARGARAWASHDLAPAPKLPEQTVIDKYNRLQKKSGYFGTDTTVEENLEFLVIQGSFEKREEDRYYLRLNEEDHKTVLDAGPEINVNISVSLLRWLSSGEYKSGIWRPSTTKDEEEWMSSRQEWKIPTREPLVVSPESTIKVLGCKNKALNALPGALPVVPVRLENGAITSVNLKVGEDGDIKRTAWQKICGRAFFGDKTTAGGKPKRFAEFKLSHPLRIVSTQTGLKWDNHFTMLQSIVTDLQAKYRREGNPDAIEMCADITGTANEDYLELSVDPFGIFVTYIHHDDWHNWMVYVGSKAPIGASPIRPFIEKPNAALAKCIKGLTDDVERGQEKFGSKPTQTTGKAKVTQGANQADSAAPKAGRTKGEMALMKRMLSAANARNKISFKETSVELNVYLEAEKIRNAKQTRDGEIDQKTVMRGVTAPEIAKQCGWPEGMWAHTNAEWLHLSGYAYGGFMMTDDEGGYSTSQIPSNLIFGTSETNSLMTRYEEAYQDYFLHEDKLRKKYAAVRESLPLTMPSAVSDGFLEIKTNQPHVDLGFDTYDPEHNRYTRDYVPFWSKKRKMTMEQKRALLLSAAPNSDANMDEAKCNERINAMKEMTASYFFIVQTIEYTIKLESSFLLCGGPIELTTCFFPFSRPLYHEYEADMDRMLRKELYSRAELRLSQVLGEDNKRRAWDDDDDYYVPGVTNGEENDTAMPDLPVKKHLFTELDKSSLGFLARQEEQTQEMQE